jgi:hypothetical protein
VSVSDNDTWKANPVSRHYDYKFVERRVAQLKKVLEDEDPQAAVYHLRSGK